MPTLACCRPDQRIRRNGRGYTLIEMVAVLAIVSLLTALAAPALYRTYRSATEQTERDGVIAQLASLSARAAALGVSFSLDAKDLARVLPDGRPVVSLPSGWQLSEDEPIHFNFAGICNGGTVRLRAPDGGEQTLALAAPACEVREQAARL